MREAFTSDGNEKMHTAYLEYLRGSPNSRHSTITSGGVDRIADAGLGASGMVNHCGRFPARRQFSDFYKAVTDSCIQNFILDILMGQKQRLCPHERRNSSRIHRIENSRLWHRYEFLLLQIWILMAMAMAMAIYGHILKRCCNIHF